MDEPNPCRLLSNYVEDVGVASRRLTLVDAVNYPRWVCGTEVGNGAMSNHDH